MGKQVDILYPIYVVKFRRLNFERLAALRCDVPILNIVQIFVIVAYSFVGGFL